MTPPPMASRTPVTTASLCELSYVVADGLGAVVEIARVVQNEGVAVRLAGWEAATSMSQAILTSLPGS